MTTTNYSTQLLKPDNIYGRKLLYVVRSVKSTSLRVKRPKFLPPSYIPIPGIGDASHIGNTDGVAGHLIRTIWRALGFNENRLFNWHLDHKLIQALIFNQFAPKTFPVTVGLRSAVNAAITNNISTEGILNKLFPQGFFIKQALTAGSGEGNRADRTAEMLRLCENYGVLVPDVSDPTLEEWVAQERISVQYELRVHSIEDMVVPGLISLRYGGEAPGGLLGDAGRFVGDVLSRLPPALVGETMYGWDIAKDASGRFMVIEVNLTGVHRAYRPGFQCSGFFQDPSDGPPLLAILLAYLESAYDLHVDLPEDVHGYKPEYFEWYKAIEHWSHQLIKGR